MKKTSKMKMYSAKLARTMTRYLNREKNLELDAYDTGFRNGALDAISFYINPVYSNEIDIMSQETAAKAKEKKRAE